MSIDLGSGEFDKRVTLPAPYAGFCVLH